jgi:hypothetical protein
MSIPRNPNRLRSLQNVLRQIRQPTRVLRFGDGSRLLILPRGGRVLGLFVSNEPENFFWTHPALGTAPAARQLLSDPRWPNPGGDRTWLAPTTELFIGDMKRIWATYREPATVDPGRYRCISRNGVLELVNRGRVRLFRSGGAALVEIRKSFGPAPDPLRREAARPAGIRYAGYSTRLSLRVLTNPRQVRIGLWPLLQLPPGGEMILPTFHRTQPRTIFGDVPRADLVVDDHLVRYRMHSPTTAKIAVRAVATTGRMGYLRQTARGQAELVVRNFSVNPSGDYLDTPFDDLADRAYAVQACNVAEPTLGHFSEIEHHVPVAPRDSDATVSAEESQVWAYRGSLSAVRRVIRQLLTGSDFRLSA